MTRSLLSILGGLIRRNHRGVQGPITLSSLLAGMSIDDPLVIAEGVEVIVDLEMTDGQRLGTITNSGTLTFSESIDTRILAESIINDGGTIVAGTSSVPHPRNIRIDLCGDRPTVSGNPGGGALITGVTHTVNVSTGNNGTTNDYQGIYRAFINMGGGTLELYGSRAPQVRRLNAHYTAGVSGTALTVDSAVTASSGATVLTTPSGFYNAATRTEVRTLGANASAATALTINSALTFDRWGKMQYFTDNGPSLTADTYTIGATYADRGVGAMRTHVDQNPELDERAFVVVLDPSIVISGYDSGNTDLATYDYGFHGMTMGFSKTVLKNVGFEEYGQKGLLGRYGWHFHMNGWDAATGDPTTGGVAGDYGNNVFAPGDALIDGCTGMYGHNRFLTLHGCLGVTIQNCVGYDALGHCFFEEDGSEEENTIDNCVAIAQRIPAALDALKVHDRIVQGRTGAVGFWFANPNNTHTDNWGVDSEGAPWLNAHSQGIDATQPDLQHGCLGQSALVPLAPFYGKMGVWDGNSGLGCGGQAGSNDAVKDNAGNFGGRLKIRATTDGVAYTSFSSATDVDLLLENLRLYKTPGYTNQVHKANYLNWRIADIMGVGISGITNSPSFVNNAQITRETLNHESNILNGVLCNAIIPYHGTVGFPNLSAWGFSGGTPAAGTDHHSSIENTCVMQTWEEYTGPVHTYSSINEGWALGECDAIWQTPPAHLTEAVTTYDSITGTAAGGPKFMDLTNGTHRRWTLGVQYDHWGTVMMGPTTPAEPNVHIVWNQPYFTTGLTVTALENNAESCWTTTPFVGLQHSAGATGTRSEQAHLFQRCDSSRVDIAGAVWSMPISLSNGGTPPDYGSFFNDDHHGVCPINGFVKWTWPGFAKPTTFISGVSSSSGNLGNSEWRAVNPNHATTDWTCWGIEWDGTVPVVGAYFGGAARTLTSVASWAALLAHAGHCYWQETADHKVWIKVLQPGSGLSWRIWASGFA